MEDSNPFSNLGNSLEYDSKLKICRKSLRAEVPHEDYAIVHRFAAKQGTTVQALLTRWIEPHIETLRVVEKS